MIRRAVFYGPCVLLLISILGITGCPKEDPFSAGDKGAVYGLVRSVSDAAGRPGFAEYFVEAAVPDETQEEKLNRFVCIPEGDIQFDGDTVTFEVTLEDNAANATVMTWSARKVDETWKLTDTPLPP